MFDLEKNRGFEIASGFEMEDINLPKRGTKFSAGYDFECAKETIFQPNEIKLVPTGIKSYMQEDEFLGIYIRSSIPLKKGLIMANSTGIVDSDYYNNSDNDGHIMFQLKNVTNKVIIIEKHERIGQGIFQKFFITDNDDSNGNRISGFGSTGK